VFRTDLEDDIHFVGVGDGKSYFDTVGKTRRQGLSARMALML
jgi:glucan biosynthesis protein